MKNRPASSPRSRGWTVGIALALLALAGPAAGQRILTRADTTIRVERAKTAILQTVDDITRISVGDSTVANVNAMTNRELLINAFQIGSTTLILWDPQNQPRLYNIEVTADATALQTQLGVLFPDAGISVTTSGNALILSGTVRDPTVSRRAAELAAQTGAQVINNLQAPAAEQVLLNVRIAEVRKTSGHNIGADLAANNVAELDQVFGEGSTANIETLSEGIMRLFLIGQDANLDATIRALKSKGEYKSLAEPNLLTMEGQEASFLAGGEFPFPTVQQGAATGAVTIMFKEFGVRLKFTPTVTASGTILLKVAPEVSALDFANGLTFAGFQIPSLLTRRAETTVELRPGQHLAIAGLMDNVMSDNIDKIPFLGDLPIIGALFRARGSDQQRTELLVLVTPHLVEATDVQPGLPTGEPRTWKWDRSMRIDTIRSQPPGYVRRDGGN